MASVRSTTENGIRRQEFVALLAQHKHRLFNLIFCVLHSLPDTEDVFQQTAATLWLKFDQFDPGTNFAAWSSKVAQYEISHYLRSRRRDRVVFSETLIEQITNLSSETVDLHELRLEALAICRQKLPPDHQRLLSMCYGGSSIRNAAEKIGRPVQSVYTSLSRIRSALFACIEKQLSKEGHL